MKYSQEKAILLYPVGTETAHPPEVVDANTFYDYDIGSGRHVWRTHDLELEVGRIGSSFYGKVRFRILEGIYASYRSAMRRCGVIKIMIANGEIKYPIPPPPPITP